MNTIILDTETCNLKLQGDYEGKWKAFPYQIGWIAENDTREIWVKLPKGCKQQPTSNNPEYPTFRVPNNFWDISGKITIEEVVQILQSYADKDYIFVGHNVKVFDLGRALKPYGLNVPDNQVWDTLKALRRFRKRYPKRMKDMSLRFRESLRGEISEPMRDSNKLADWWNYLSKTDLVQEHSALSDCMVLRFCMREMRNRYGSEWLQCLEESAV